MSMTAKINAINTIMQGIARITRKAETGEFRITDMRLRTTYKDEGIYYTDNLEDALDKAGEISTWYCMTGRTSNHA